MQPITNRLDEAKKRTAGTDNKAEEILHPDIIRRENK